MKYGRLPEQAKSPTELVTRDKHAWTDITIHTTTIQHYYNKYDTSTH